MSAKILVITGDFVEDLEIWVPVQMLKMLDYEVHVVSPGKSTGDPIATAVHDMEGYQTFTEKRGHLFYVNENFVDVDVDEYDGLYLPGGRAPEFLRNDKEVIDVVRLFHDAGKPIAAQCHGPLILARADILTGTRVTAYPELQPDMETCGAVFVERDVHDVQVDADRNIVTAPVYHANPRLIKEFVRLLDDKKWEHLGEDVRRKAQK